MRFWKTSETLTSKDINVIKVYSWQRESMKSIKALQEHMRKDEM